MAFNISYKFEAIDAFSGVAAKIKSSVSGINSKFGQLVQSSKKASASLDEVGKSIRGVGQKMTLFATTSIGFLGYSMIRAASDAEETRSKFETVFSSISENALSASKDLSRAFGFSRENAEGLLASTGNLLTGIGFTQKEALKLSESVVKMGADLASFTNYSGGAAGAADAIRKALLGEREMLKALDISISENQVKTKIATMGAEKFKGKTLEQAKAMATLEILFEKGKNAVGDFQKTSKSTSNQSRTLTERLKDLSVTIGRKLEPTFNIIQGRVIKLIERFEDFAEVNPRITKIALAVAGITAALGPVLIALGLMASGFALIISPVALVAAGIATVAAGLVYAWNKFEGFRKSISLAGRLLFAVFKVAMIPVRLLAKGIGAIVDLFFPAREGARSVSYAINSISLDGLLNGMESFVSVIEDIAAWLENIFSLEPLENAISNSINSVKTKLSDLTSGALEFVGLGTDNTEENIKMATEKQQGTQAALMRQISIPSVAAQEVTAKSRLDANINLKAPAGMVGNTSTKVSGASMGNVGLSVAEAGL